MRVLVLGAGPIGLCAVAAARHLGADVDVEGHRADRVAAGERLGASTAVGRDYDVVLDAAGTQASLDRATEVARPGGTLGIVGTYWSPVALGVVFQMKELTLVPAFTYGHHHGVGEFTEAARILAHLPELADTVVTHHFALDDAAEAFRVAGDPAEQADQGRSAPLSGGGARHRGVRAGRPWWPWWRPPVASGHETRGDRSDSLRYAVAGDGPGRTGPRDPARGEQRLPPMECRRPYRQGGVESVAPSSRLWSAGSTSTGPRRRVSSWPTGPGCRCGRCSTTPAVRRGCSSPPSPSSPNATGASCSPFRPRAAGAAGRGPVPPAPALLRTGDPRLPPRP